MADPEARSRPSTSVPHIDTSKAQAWRWDADRAVSSAKAIPMSPGRIRPNRVSSIGLPVHNSNPTPNEGATSSQPLRGQKPGERMPPEMAAMLKTLKKMEWAPPGGHVRVGAVSSSMVGQLSTDLGHHDAAVAPSTRPSTAEPPPQAPLLTKEEVGIMSKALVAAEKHMESERKHSNEMFRGMKAVLDEGRTKFEAKKEKRRTKEFENLRRLEAGQAVILQMTASMAEMKARQAQNHKSHTEAVKLAERALMHSAAQGGSADMQRLKVQLDVEQGEMARLEQEELDMKTRFAALHQEVRNRLGEKKDLEPAMRRIEMQERVANERMAMKRTRHVKAMELLKSQLAGDQMDLSEEARATANRLKEQQAQTESMEQAFLVWETGMNLKLDEARKGVESLNKKIDDDKTKWDTQTLPSMELQMQRAEKEVDARMQERVRLERNMNRALEAMKKALEAADKTLEDSSSGAVMAAVSSCRTFSDEFKQFWTCQRHSNMLGTTTSRSSSSNGGSSANSPRDHVPTSHNQSINTGSAGMHIHTADAYSHPPAVRRNSSTFRRRSEHAIPSLDRNDSVGLSNAPAVTSNTPVVMSNTPAAVEEASRSTLADVGKARPGDPGQDDVVEASVGSAGDARTVAVGKSGGESAKEARSATVSIPEYTAMLAARKADERKPTSLPPDSAHVPPNPNPTDQQHSATSANRLRKLSEVVVEAPNPAANLESAAGSDTKYATESTAAQAMSSVTCSKDGNIETNPKANEVASSSRPKEPADSKRRSDSTSSIASTAGQLPASSQVGRATNEGASKASRLEVEDSDSDSDEEVLGSADKAMSDMLVKNWTPFRSKIKTQPGLALRRAVAANPPPPPSKADDAPAQRSTSSNSNTEPLPNQPGQSSLSSTMGPSIKSSSESLAHSSMELRANVSTSHAPSSPPSSTVASTGAAANEPNTKANARTKPEPTPASATASRPLEVGAALSPKPESVNVPQESDPPASGSIDSRSTSSFAARLAEDSAEAAGGPGVSAPRTSNAGSGARVESAGSSEAALSGVGRETRTQESAPKPSTPTSKLEPAASRDDPKVPDTSKGGMGTAKSDMKEQGQTQDKIDNPLINKTPACYSFTSPPKGAAWQESATRESSIASDTGSDSKSTHTSSSTCSTTSKPPSQGAMPPVQANETKQEAAERRAAELRAYRAEAVARERLRARAKEASDRDTSERKHAFEMLKATGLEADRLKHEQEETNRKAILEQQRLREETLRRTREQEALQAEREARERRRKQQMEAEAEAERARERQARDKRREEMAHQQREQQKLEQERLRRMAQERVAEATRQREELRQKEAKQQHQAGSGPAGGWQQSAAAAEEAATRRRHSAHFGQSNKPEAQQPGTKQDWWDRVRKASFFHRDPQPNQTTPPNPARPAGNRGAQSAGGREGGAPTGGDGGSRPGSAAPGSGQSRYARAGASSRPSSATSLGSQRRSSMSEYDQLKEKVAAQLQEKCGSMDVCAAMSALGVPLTATGNIDSDIRKRYKKAALKFHPDRNRQEDLNTRIHAEEAWMLITAKYDSHFAGR